ncbi:hypothetical protein Vadar_009451 [Vaccinium darrowii]|uniref:Uncharacterized protein n=1 Tax=Vaccinium darrowii TaxID=229202 RepID=A0ACB7XPC3_9ERIC|nr:hypothetical protein Vadar_009451 [Vaccinium darrowii]
MASSAINSGALVTLQELNSTSPHFKQGASLRVTGRLQEFSVETAVALIVDGNATLKVDTQHLNLSLRLGLIYQFIGELLIQPNHEDYWLCPLALGHVGLPHSGCQQLSITNLGLNRTSRQTKYVLLFAKCCLHFTSGT